MRFLHFDTACLCLLIWRNMKDWILFCIFIPVCYILGSINFALIISAIKNKDIRALGSGNPGTMNMLRSLGTGWGVLTFLLDFAKGVSAALIGMFAFKELSHAAPYVLGFSAMLGHVFPVFAKFKGGKGVATTLGVYAVVQPIAWSVAFIIMLVYLKLSKTGFIGSLIAVYLPALTSIIMNSVMQKSYWYLAVIFSCTWILVITYAHRDNFKRLKLGKEHSLSLFDGEGSATLNTDGCDINDDSCTNSNMTADCTAYNDCDNVGDAALKNADSDTIN